MILPSLWLLAALPLVLVAAGLAARPRLAEAGAATALAIAVTGAVAAALLGPLRTGTIGFGGVGFGLTLDALSATMIVLVAFVGLVVVRFSRAYLGGDPGQGRFTRWLCLTLATGLTLIVSGNLFQLWLAWIATSLALHRLLLFYPDRPAAILGARKKFVSSRLGDLGILGAMIVLYRAVGSLDLTALFAAARADVVPPAATVLLVIAALIKSAQVPFHGWLTEVMETPTPVSALLHAGVINAGGFLVLRFAPLIAGSPAALDLLTVVGGLTALFGSAVMLTQTSVKVSLAYSTVAQMGFMMLECGLGVFSAALLHIVAHSLYKAHAFLSSGSVIDLARASWSPSPSGRPHPWRTSIAAVAVIAASVAVGAAMGLSLPAQPGLFALAAVLLLGLMHLFASGVDERPSPTVVGRVALTAAAGAVAYFALQGAAAWLTAGVLPRPGPRGPLDLALIVGIVAAFAVVTVVQGQLAAGVGGMRWLGLYTHVANGFYLNTLANRLALRLWPRAARPIAATGGQA